MTSSAPATALAELPGAAAWRLAQAVVWVVGVALVGLLWLAPTVGIHAFWNVLIPVAPALVAVAPGLWRNICPLATTALLPRHLGGSAARAVSPHWRGRLALLGVALLFAIVPLRHVALDTSGVATAIVLVAIASVAFVVGTQTEWKSGWCSGFCPVHPVERLYGVRPAFTLPNAHCTSCARCTEPCPDSTPDATVWVNGGRAQVWARELLAGAFVGYIVGWFHVPDYVGGVGWAHLGAAYAWPFAGAAVTLALFLAVRSAVPATAHPILRRVFAAAAISAYYWYRVPALVGLGPFPGDGMLVDLSAALPAWFEAASRTVTTAFFGWWIVWRPALHRAWCARPAFATAGGVA